MDDLHPLRIKRRLPDERINEDGDTVHEKKEADDDVDDDGCPYNADIRINSGPVYHNWRFSSNDNSSKL
jgi:hypothetical protein